MKSHSIILTGLCLLAINACDSGSNNWSENITTPDGDDPPPNILFVIMDDVGVDQMPSMGYGGLEPPVMPSIDAIAKSGVRFRNTWSMPECSPGRVALLAGRYPLRTNIYQAIGPQDLANSQLSPYEVTSPKLLKEAGYESAMFGKFHLAGPDYNPAENGTPAALGWDYFYGWTGGLPGSIDTTAGGVAAEGSYSCGYVPSRIEDPHNGAAFGACYTPQGSDDFSCEELDSDPFGDSAGLQCLSRGGVLVPDRSCQASLPTHVDFEKENAHYVSPLVVNHKGTVEEFPLHDLRGRRYRSSIETDAARDWINNASGLRDESKPWMATVSFSSAHTPLQTPPKHLLPSGGHPLMEADCRIQASTIPNQRLLTNAMIESMDHTLGELLVDTNIATRGAGNEIVYRPESNTLVVIVGDNGSLGFTVKLPGFDPTRAKGTAYQTGVWVPLIVAGPMVESPDRDVEHMVNAADVFHLFGEAAGLPVTDLVPGEFDGQALMPYLLDPNQSSIRDYNFTQGGLNIQKDNGRNGPCVIGVVCSHTPVSKTVCEDNGGVWWGVGADDPEVVNTHDSGGLEQCWQVNQAIYYTDPASYDNDRIDMGWTRYQAIRNANYKLVHNHALDYDPTTDDATNLYSEEFYQIDQAAPIPALDSADRDLLAAGLSALDQEEQRNFDELNQALAGILASKPGCPGDGNYDGRVDAQDLLNFANLVDSGWNGSSWYDFNYDGKTDRADFDILRANLGQECAK